LMAKGKTPRCFCCEGPVVVGEGGYEHCRKCKGWCSGCGKCENHCAHDARCRSG